MIRIKGKMLFVCLIMFAMVFSLIPQLSQPAEAETIGIITNLKYDSDTDKLSWDEFEGVDYYIVYLEDSNGRMEKRSEDVKITGNEIENFVEVHLRQKEYVHIHDGSYKIMLEGKATRGGGGSNRCTN